MKYLLTLLLLVNTAYAVDCANELAKYWDYENDDVDQEQFVIRHTSFTAELVKRWNEVYDYGESISQQCIDIMTAVDFKTPEGKWYTEITTNSDECDGGNVYGLIFEANSDKIVGEIGDSEFYCPRVN